MIKPTMKALYSRLDMGVGLGGCAPEWSTTSIGAALNEVS